MIHLTHIFKATYFQAKVEELEKYIFYYIQSSMDIQSVKQDFTLRKNPAKNYQFIMHSMGY